MSSENPVNNLNIESNPFVNYHNPCNQIQTKITELRDGTSPSTVPIALIIGIIAGIAVHCIATHFTSNAHSAIFSGIGAGVIVFGLAIGGGSAVQSVRKHIDMKKEKCVDSDCYVDSAGHLLKE